MYLTDIVDMHQFQALVEQRFINRVQSLDGRFALYNYTEKATYERRWTRETVQARGLIVEAVTGRIVAWPFNKFFNLGELGDTPASLATRGTPTLTSKLDGSLVMFWHDGAQWRAATRGNFASHQAASAYTWVQAHTAVRAWPIHVTVLVEWCAPDNRIVVGYGEPRATLIGARDLRTGDDYDQAALQTLGPMLQLPVVSVVSYSLLEALEARETMQAIEGWVARFPDGYRVKIKTAEYLRLHKLVTGVTPARVREALLDGTLAAWLQAMPEEFRHDVEAIAGAITARAAAIEADVRATFAALAPLATLSRGAFARAAAQSEYRTYLFSLLDNRPIRAAIIKSIDLHGIAPAAAREAEL